jgi:hypothetical protein
VDSHFGKMLFRIRKFPNNPNDLLLIAKSGENKNSPTPKESLRQMLKQTARFAALALFMFAASANPLTAKASLQFDGPSPYSSVAPALTATSVQFDNPIPYPPMPPSCLPAPCPVGVVR